MKRTAAAKREGRPNNPMVWKGPREAVKKRWKVLQTVAFRHPCGGGSPRPSTRKRVPRLRDVPPNPATSSLTSPYCTSHATGECTEQPERPCLNHYVSTTCINSQQTAPAPKTRRRCNKRGAAHCPHPRPLSRKATVATRPLVCRYPGRRGGKRVSHGRNCAAAALRDEQQLEFGQGPPAIPSKIILSLLVYGTAILWWLIADAGRRQTLVNRYRRPPAAAAPIAPR